MNQTASKDKKRHHFIPIAYLEKFADDGGKVFAYRKNEVQNPFHVKPRAIAFERYYYSQPLPEGGRDNNALEDFFSTLEATWTPLVERLRLGSDTNSDFEALCTFMGLMRARVAAARDMVEVFLAEQVKAVARLLDRRGKLPPKPEGCENILDQVSVSIDPHQSLRAMSALAKGFGIVVGQLEFEVIHNRTDVSFLTSDNPVIYFDPTVPDEKVLPYQVRPPHGEIELLFPIDASTVIRGRMGSARLIHVDLSDPQFAKRVNRFVARFGYRFVFSRDKTHEALIAKHAGTSPVIQAINMASATAEALVFEWVFGIRPTKPKWTA